ncbi:hypothetical protein M1105_08000 [Limibaculum sp. FT325]|uniref:hypothetical protein n=1 Tax=Thermohalobaculum sediminis TaxID=2939436 RepID=UPI0020BD6325|nr:hypothetical protein [Limibaculum sediminis]MCL5776925.1 hypothetical protein [Limibaculum sediminis]
MRLYGGLILVGALLLAACAADTQPLPQSAERESLITRRAVVETVDVEGRQVLLRGESGRMLSITAGPDVRNLAQLESGDVVKLQYYEAVAVKMADPSNPGDPTAVAVVERAPEGERPGGAVGKAVNLVVDFISYDPASSVATFSLPDGTVETAVVKPEMREFAAARKSGDRIDLTITRALAISIEESQ